jgi:hypothetical protein
MGDRTGRTTRRFDSADLIALTKKPILAEEQVPQDDDPFVDWDERKPLMAAGSQSDVDKLPSIGRAVTLHDPLTTGLLAEVARRTQTMEIDPSTMVAYRNTAEIDPEILRNALREGAAAEAAPVVPVTPPEAVHANTRRRVK